MNETITRYQVTYLIAGDTTEYTRPCLTVQGDTDTSDFPAMVAIAHRGDLTADDITITGYTTL